MVSQEELREELKNHLNGILQIELARKLNCVDKTGKYNNSFYNPMLALLKRREIRREKAENGGFIIFLIENKE